MKLGANIRTLRTKKGITQKELSEALGFSCQNVSKWETDQGMPDVPTLLALANYFNVSLDLLTGNAPTEETFSLAVSVNEIGISSVYTDFAVEGKAAPLSSTPGRRRCGSEETDTASHAWPVLLLAVNAKGKIANLFTIDNQHIIYRKSFYYRQEDIWACFAPGTHGKEDAQILIPQGGMMLVLPLGDHLTKQLLTFVVPEQYHCFLDNADPAYNHLRRSHDGRHLFHQVLAHGELDHITVTLQGDALCFSKPLAFVDPLADNIDALTRIVKNQMEHTFQKLRTELSVLRNEIEELRSEIEELHSEVEELQDMDLDDLESRLEALEQTAEQNEEE